MRNVRMLMDGRRLIPLADVQTAPVIWLWANRIPQGAITLLEGDPGQGKSSIAYDLVTRLTRGDPMPNCKDTPRPRPAGAVLLQGEDSVAATVRPTLETAGADQGR